MKLLCYQKLSRESSPIFLRGSFTHVNTSRSKNCIMWSWVTLHIIFLKKQWAFPFVNISLTFCWRYVDTDHNSYDTLIIWQILNRYAHLFYISLDKGCGKTASLVPHWHAFFSPFSEALCSPLKLKQWFEISFFSQRI